MRRCWLGIFFALWICATMNGCFIADWLYGKPKGSDGPTTAETIQTVAHSFGPIGDLISLAIGLGGTIYGANRHTAHRKVRKENQVLKAKVPADQHPPAA